MEPHAYSNVIVAAFVTVKARLKFYKPLAKLNERVLYFDTDSIIYHHKPHLWNPTIVNNRLVELTDEVPNVRIVKEFLAIKRAISLNETFVLLF